MISKKNKKIRFSFEVHSFKHLYNNYNFFELINYAVYLQNIYFHIHFKSFYIRSAEDKSCLVRGIREIELSLVNLIGGGVDYDRKENK